MNILITGGAGFLGQRLAHTLLQRGQLNDQSIQHITLLDVVPANTFNDPRVRAVTSDIGDGHSSLSDLKGWKDPSDPPTVIFHLAAVLSGQAEQDFDLGMRVNVDGTRALLNACRALGTRPTFVFSSTTAVFGGALPDVVPDTWRLTPENSYGAQKAMCELLVADMSRKGFINGRCVRLPTITVRPGKPNRAASSFASGIIREPLGGIDAPCPVSPDTRIWVLSPLHAVNNLIVAGEAPQAAFDGIGTINLPGLSVSAGEMVQALGEVAGVNVAARVTWQFDAEIARLVASWPAALNADRGRALGMMSDANFADVIRQYMEDQSARADG